MSVPLAAIDLILFSRLDYLQAFATLVLPVSSSVYLRPKFRRLAFVPFAIATVSHGPSLAASCARLMRIIKQRKHAK